MYMQKDMYVVICIAYTHDIYCIALADKTKRWKHSLLSVT